MSGKPNIEQITELRGHIRRVKSAGDNVLKQQSIIESATRNLNESQQAYNESRKAIFALMGAMDVYESGNTGFEGRMCYMLGVLLDDE